MTLNEKKQAAHVRTQQLTQQLQSVNVILEALKKFLTSKTMCPRALILSAVKYKSELASRKGLTGRFIDDSIMFLLPEYRDYFKETCKAAIPHIAFAKFYLSLIELFEAATQNRVNAEALKIVKNFLRKLSDNQQGYELYLTEFGRMYDKCAEKEVLSGSWGNILVGQFRANILGKDRVIDEFIENKKSLMSLS